MDTSADSCATLKLVERAILGHLAHRILDVLRGHFRKDDDVLPLEVKRIVLLVIRVQERLTSFLSWKAVVVLLNLRRVPSLGLLVEIG